VNLVSYKNKTSEVVLETYKSRGISFTLDLCTKILESEESRNRASIQDRNIVAGEICESVLEVSILDYMRLNREFTQNWYISKGLVMKDLDNPDSRFLTEIDLVLFTPQVIFIFECKNYIGNKVIQGQGEIIRSNGRNFNVFKQHLMHAKVLIRTFDVFKTLGNSDKFGYRLAAFIFSLGKMEDVREDKWKEFFPFLTMHSIRAELDFLKKKKPIYDMERARKAVKMIERNKEKLTIDHLNYVKSLGHNRNTNKA
jgi:hypothetical protein